MVGGGGALPRLALAAMGGSGGSPRATPAAEVGAAVPRLVLVGACGARLALAAVGDQRRPASRPWRWWPAAPRLETAPELGGGALLLHR
jgi:hypothetical protein